MGSGCHDLKMGQAGGATIKACPHRAIQIEEGARNDAQAHTGLAASFQLQFRATEMRSLLQQVPRPA